MNGPTYSEDGQWVWDGNDWVPVAQPMVPINHAVNQYDPMQVTPQPMQVNPQSYSQTPGQVVVYSSPQSSSSKPIIIVVSLVIGVAVLIGLAWGLYAWASELAEEAEENDPNLVGIWSNPADRLDLESNGDMSDSSGILIDWHNNGDSIYFDSDNGTTYKFKYLINYEWDVVFLVPYDTDGDLSEEDCIAYFKGTQGSNSSYFDDRINQVYDDGAFPSWCDA